MKTLPYFRWYPADAETDTKYKRMTFAQRGLYHTCLNHSWINVGLPADLDELAGEIGTSRKQLDSLWAAVGKCWYQESGRLFNKRQEEERTHAITKSERNTRAVRTRYERTTNVGGDVEQRAYVSESVSESVSHKTRVVDLNGQTSQRFEDWWLLWSKARGTFKKHAAAQAYVSVVTTELEGACLECTRSYLASLKDRSNGYNPDNFLFQQAQDNFAGRWIPRKKTVSEVLADEEAEAERIDREGAHGGD